MLLKNQNLDFYKRCALYISLVEMCTKLYLFKYDFDTGGVGYKVILTYTKVQLKV